VLGLDLDDLDVRRRQVRIMGKGGARVFQTITLDAVRALQACGRGLGAERGSGPLESVGSSKRWWC